MKKYLILAALLLSGLMIHAGDVEWRLGGGFDAYAAERGAEPEIYPIGFSAFAGAGYIFTPRLALAGEYEFGRSWSLDDLDLGENYSTIKHYPRIVLEYGLNDELALNLTGGLALLQHLTDGTGEGWTTAPALGVRLNILLWYIQYSAFYVKGNIAQNLGAGVAFNF